jgi:ankyrin repeat protein
MNLPQPPPQHDDPIMTQFKPAWGQWELNDENINRIDPETGHTILHNYCQSINTTPLEVYRYLIETLGCNVNALDNDKNTPVHVAFRCFHPTQDGGNIAVLMYLLNQNGIDGNIKDKNGCTLLHMACQKIAIFPIDVFKLLIEAKGCDINVQNNYKDTPIHLAFRCFPPNNGDNITALTYLFSQKGIDGNIKDNYGYTVLHMACQKITTFPLEIFQHLIETLGADINAQTNGNFTPINLAFHSFNPNDGGNAAALTYLFSQKGIDGNIKDNYGYTVLHYACKKINNLPLDVFQHLIETLGCDVNEQDKYNDTPIHSALDRFDPNKGGDTDLLTYLINQKDVNLNIKNEKGRNLLHTTCTNNSDQRSVELNAECDATLCQIVELIAERCVQEVFDEKTPLEATTTM